MDRYITFVLKHPVWILVCFIGITIGLGLGIPKLTFDTSISKFLPETDPEYLYYNKVKDVYGDVDTFVILSITGDPLWGAKTFSDMDALLTDIEAYETYRADKETARLAKLDQLLAAGPVNVADLLFQFSDDPEFARMISRKLRTKGITDGTLDSRDVRNLKKAIHTVNVLKQKESIDDIISPLDIEDVTGQDDTLATVRLIETDASGKRLLPQTPADFAAFTRKLKRNPAFERGIYATDEQGNITDFGFIIRFKEMSDSDSIAREILEIVDTYKNRLHILPQGQPLVYVWINNYMQNDLARLVPLVLLVTMFIFFLNFRSLRGVLLPSATLLMGTCWILGLMGHLGVAITTVGISIPILMIAVGSSYGIHILNQYYADFDYITRQGEFEGLRHSMNHISITVLLTGLTTFVAFLTLASHRLSVIREWGIFSAIGIVFAVWISASVIPAGLVLMSHKKDRYLLNRKNNSSSTYMDHFIRGMSSLSIHYYKPTMLFVVLLMAVCLVGLFRIQVETELLSYFRADNPIRTSAVDISKKFGGRWGFNILLNSGEPDGVKDPEFLKSIADLRSWLTSSENADLHVGRTDAFNDHINTMHMAMNNDDPEFYMLPESKWDILDYLELFTAEDADSDGRADIFEPYVNPQFQTCNILARLCEKDGQLIGTSGLKHIFERIRIQLNQTLPPEYTYKITGHPLMIIKSADYIIYGQIQSLLLTLLVIGIVVLILLKNLKAGLLALIPMSVGVIINFGIMGWFSINLDIATSLIAAITIGIGVDDTIHFLNTFRFYRKSGLDVDTAIERTQFVAGKAILFTSLALIFGFSVLGISTFKPLILFGLLMGITMIATTFGALVVLPAAIKLTGVQLVPAVSFSPYRRTFMRIPLPAFLSRNQNPLTIESGEAE